MKNLFALLICLLVIIGVSATVFAAGTATITVTPSKTAANRGDEIVFTVSISEVENLRSAGFALNYDTTVFTVVEGSLKCLASDASSSSFKYNSNAGAYLAMFMLEKAETFSGDIFQFTLKVKENAALNTESAVSLGSVSVRDSSGLISSAAKNTSVKIDCNHTYGEWAKANDKDHTRTCTVSGCGHTETAAHQWDAGTVTKKPSCTEAGVKTYTCGDCKATKIEAIDQEKHTYTNACDTDCNVCGTTRTVTHTYKTQWSSDGTGHWHACSVCGTKKDEAAHTPGAGPTEWKAQTCTICGYELKAALGHTHKFQLTWTSDSKGHWHKCTGCDDVGSYENHVYDHDCDTQCNTCGYTRTISHVYMNRWSYDADGHWHECSICGDVLEKSPHITDSQDDEQRCTVCGYVEPKEEHTHTFQGDWFRDENNHWQQCSCGELSEMTPHAWDNGVKDGTTGDMVYTCTTCGAKKTEPGNVNNDPTENTTGTDATEPGPAEKDPAEESPFPWKIAIIVVGVLVASLSAYLIIGIIGGKKQKGKFSAK